jgi:flavin-dependent dehydrogenase
VFETDVFVIGGGPAGIAAAIAARRRGMDVIVADGNRPPLDKACGEGLMPDSRHSAERIGIHIPCALGFEFRGIRFQGEGRHVQADFPEGRGLGVRRTVLHQLLIETAIEAGVDLRWGTPILSTDSMRARWIIGADGAASRVRRDAGLDTAYSNTRRFAYRKHFAIVPWTDSMEIYWGPGCQIYVTPVREREICVALISREQGLRIDEAVARSFPALRERLAGAPPSSTERGAMTITRRLKRVACGNIALIGDASGSVDAITGEGICLSFKQAALLADAMANGDLSAYDRAHPRLALKPHVMAKAMLMLDRGRMIRRLGLGAMSRQPWIFRKLLAVHVA